LLLKCRSVIAELEWNVWQKSKSALSALGFEANENETRNTWLTLAAATDEGQGRGEWHCEKSSCGCATRLKCTSGKNEQVSIMTYFKGLVRTKNDAFRALRLAIGVTLAPPEAKQTWNNREAWSLNLNSTAQYCLARKTEVKNT
jgi:hypothetical protein